MNIALCSAFLEEDVWEDRLCEAGSPQKLEITECNSTVALLRILDLKPFSLIVVTLNGTHGLEAVRQLREKESNIPLLWITDEDFSLLSYQYHVTYFLRRPVSDVQLREAIVSSMRQSY